MNIKTIFSVIILSIFTSVVFAQEKNDLFQNFQIEGRIVKGKSIFKILPMNQGSWFLGLKNGYSVYISTFENGKYSDYKLIEDNLRPASEKDFENPALPKNYATPMRKMIYEETYQPVGNSFDAMLNANETMSYHLLAYLLFSSYDTRLSQMSGLQFTPDQDPGEVFKIKVEINDNPGYVYEQVIRKEFLHSISKSPHIEAIPGDKVVTIQWNHKNFKDLFVAYALERASRGQGFQQIGTPIPFNSLSEAGQLGMISWVDSIPENYKEYWYIVRGYDFFGYLSDPADTLKVMGKDMTAPRAPLKVYAEHSSPDSITISWSQVKSSDLYGFQVISSMSENGEYTLVHKNLLPSSQFSYRFKKGDVVDKYYRVIAVDTARNASSSGLGYLILVDTIPPSIPDSIVVEVDSNHVATIKWTHSKSTDISGYRVFKAFHPSNGFVPITPVSVTDTIFRDSLPHNRLDKKIYYKVLAIDNNYNRSELSAYASARIPDFIPPTEPLLIKAELNTLGHVELEWYQSSSNDVALYSVLRRIENDTIYRIIYSDSSEFNHYTDTSFDTLKVNYAEYYIQASDSSGNISNRSNGKRVLQKHKASATAISTIIIGEVDNVVEINWEYSSENDFSVLIYRTENGNAYSLIDRVSDQSTYIDMNVKAGIRYGYKLGVIESSGKRHPLSDETFVKLK